MYTQWPKLLRFFKVKHNISIKMSHRTQLPARLCRCGRSRVWGFWRTPPPLPSWEPPQTSTNCLFSGCVLEAQHPPVCSPVGLRAWMLQVTALWKLSTTVFPPLILLPCWVHGLARVDWRRQVLEGMPVCAGMGVGRSGLGCHDRQQHVWKHSVSHSHTLTLQGVRLKRERAVQTQGAAEAEQGVEVWLQVGKWALKSLCKWGACQCVVLFVINVYLCMSCTCIYTCEVKWSRSVVSDSLHPHGL